MTASRLRPYQVASEPAPGSVAVSVVVLTKNEAVNIERCLASVRWARQVVVLDSGSTDGTVELARRAGATVVVESWRGYGAQREFALRLPLLSHEWVYFVDADEWVSDALATEISHAVTGSIADAYSHRLRLIFQGRWIRHCGWYRGSWVVRLVRRSAVHFSDEAIGERIRISGPTGRLQNDIVDEDLKGHASWLRKHVGYAELEAGNLVERPAISDAWRSFRASRHTDSRPLSRAIAKDLVLPFLPGFPALLFVYMYVFALGFLDGRAGLNFCVNHAWYRLTIESLRAERSRRDAGAMRQDPPSVTGDVTIRSSQVERAAAASGTRSALQSRR